MRRRLGLFGFLILLLCPGLLESQSCSPNLSNVSVALYNAHNLFDNTYDGDKEYKLPPGYNQAVVQDKKDRIKKVITRDGKCLPDVLCLVEIENENVAHQAASYFGYKYMFMTKSPDSRGIDVALMFNETVTLKRARYRNEVKYNRDEFEKSPSRNILIVDLDVGGRSLILIVVHWPSMRNPIEMSVAAAEETRKVVEEQAAKYPNATIAVLGDFNSIPSKNAKDGRNPYDDILLKGKGAGPQLFNARTATDPAVLRPQVPGTYFYKDENSWNELDRIAILEGPFVKFDRKSYFVFPHPEFSAVLPTSNGAPAPIGYFYNWENGKLVSKGASDHFPVFVSFTVTSESGAAPTSPEARPPK